MCPGILSPTNERAGSAPSANRISSSAFFRSFITSATGSATPKSLSVQAEFGDWGRRRFDQGIPLSEIVYAVIVLKQHMARYILDNGLVDAAFPRVDSDYVLPMHLNSLQDLNTQVGQFFDEALYHLACGYEDEAKRLDRQRLPGTPTI